jgi:hypothetical protein
MNKNCPERKTTASYPLIPEHDPGNLKNKDEILKTIVIFKHIGKCAFVRCQRLFLKLWVLSVANK